MPGRAKTISSSRRAPRRRRRPLGCETLETRWLLDSTVVFNEMMFHPADGSVEREWIELHNQQAVPMDLSGWTLSGGVDYSFPAGTVVPGGGYLVVGADPTVLLADGIFAAAMGPWTGQLDNGGEALRLVDNDGRVMDELDYGDEDPWPVGPDGSGATLAKFDVNSATEEPSNWRTSGQVGGTPGARNFNAADPSLIAVVDAGATAQLLVPSAADDALIGNTWTSTDFVPGAAGETAWSTGPTGIGYDAAPVSYSDEVLADAPYGYWKLDETTGATAADSSGNNRHATFNGGVALGASGAPGIGGRATTFNGSNSFVQLPGTWGGPTWNAVTVEAWVNTADPITGQFQSILSGHDPSAFTHFQLNSAGNMGAYTTSGFVAAPIVPATPTGVWRHVAMVIQSGESRVYVDGQPFGSAVATTFSSIQAASNVSIGLGHAGGRWFKGEIDEVAVYDTALTADRITAHYNAGIGVGGYTNLIGTDTTDAMHNAQASAYVRVPFTIADAAAVDQLQLQVQYDDGFVAYLNGVEVSRRNAPSPLAFDSSATASRPDAAAVTPESINLNAHLGDLRSGGNVLAFHALNESAADDDFLLVPRLLVHQTDVVRSVSINEVSGALDETFQLELTNHGTSPQSLAGYELAASTVGATPFVLPNVTLAPGEFFTISQSETGWRPLDGDRVFLYAPGRVAVVDAIEVKNSLRGRSPGGTGRWLRPDVATFGSTNSFALQDDVVINEIMYHHRPTLGDPGTPDVVETTVLVPLVHTWKYLATGGDPGTVWRNVGFDDSTWLGGPGVLGYETSPQNLPEPIGTTVAPALRWTYYFRTTFEYNGGASPVLQLRTILDDGAVVYLNGTEIFRLGVADGPVDFMTPSSRIVPDAVYEGPFPLAIPPGLLIDGTNTLAVEVHQQATSSSDMIMGLELAEVGNVIPGTPPTPLVESPEEWIELYNRGDSAVDLSQWKLRGGIGYDFAPGTTIAPNEYLVVARDSAALAAKYPSIAIVGDFSGQLNNRDDSIVLEDAIGNPADEVRYFEGGRWPSAADGGGSSLELRDSNADNSQPEAWAASDEGSKSAWTTYTYRGKATADIGPTNFNELMVGLLDSGEMLLDDIRVVADPDGTARQLIQNQSFDSGTASTWRLLGNHSGGGVIVDPTDPANFVLRLVATGQSEHMSNHLETTLKDGATLHTVSGATTYEISFRAKWIGGSRQLRTNLYFNRLPRVTAVDAPSLHGTPGAANSRLLANDGPTYTDLSHGPVVPADGEDVSIFVAANDPDAVASMTLHYSVAGGAWSSAAMTQAGGNRYVGTVPGQDAATVVQFYVEGTDSLGAASTFPAAGRDSRALYKVQDNLAEPGGAHDLRIIMTPADAALLHANANLMSNDRLGATVVYDEHEVYYDVGVRLKGTPYGRPADVFVSYNLSFNPEQKFRGVHESVGVDRSARGPVGSPNVDEIVIRHVANHAGGIANVYDDIVRVITPLPQHTSVALLKMGTYGREWLDSYYNNGSDTAVHEFDGAYYFTRTTDGNPESPKVVEPGPISYTDIRDLGNDKESYRRNWRTTNHRAADEYDRVIALNQAFSETGAALDAAVEPLMDVDQWMRHYALLSLTGVSDTYTHGNPHNLRVYERPTDGRLISLPHDMDTSFSRSTSAGLWGGSNWNLVKIITRPHNLRLFLGHLDDLIDTTYNTTYMADWTDAYGDLAGVGFGAVLSYIGTRASFVQGQIPAQVPVVPFSITTNGGSAFSVDATTVTLEGDGWVNVRTIRLAGTDDPLDVTWTDQNSWQAIVPVAFGANPVTLEAYDFQGNLIDSDTIAITSTVSARPLQDHLRIGELNYHPADPSAEEFAAGFNDADDFEFLEFVNTSASVTLDLAGASLVDGVSHTLAASTLAPLGYGVLVANTAAFQFRYGDDIAVLGEYSGQLSNGGESLRLVDTDGATIHEFVYDDNGVDWHPSTDGDGYSLVKIDTAAALSTWSEAAAWRPSFEVGGSPGARDTMRGDVNGDLRVNLTDLAIVSRHFGTPSGATSAEGDANGDGAIDRADAAILARNFGRSYTPPVASPSAIASPSAAEAVVRQRLGAARNATRRDVSLLAARARRGSPDSAAISPRAVDEALGAFRATRGIRRMSHGAISTHER